MDALIVACINLLIAIGWRRSSTGPDEGVWLLWGLSDTPYTKLIDPKPPGIHLWMRLLALITGKRLPLMKTLHHLAIGGLMVYVTLQTDVWVGMAGTAFVQSVYLLSYQSWMDAMSGALLLSAAVSLPAVAVVFAICAVGFNIKTVVPAVVVVAAVAPIGFVVLFSLVALAGGVVTRFLLPAVWYNTITIPARMTAHRREMTPYWEAWHYSFVTSLPVVLLLCAGALHTSPLIVAGAAAYTILNSVGGVWRPNHFLPLVVLAVGFEGQATIPLALLVIEALSTRLWTRDPYTITYPNIVPLLRASARVAEVLAEREGDVWVNSMHTEIYSLAGKPCKWGMSEVIEAAQVARERIDQHDRQLNATPPTWVVLGPGQCRGTLDRYRQVTEIGPFKLLRYAR